MSKWWFRCDLFITLFSCKYNWIDNSDSNNQPTIFENDILTLSITLYKLADKDVQTYATSSDTDVFFELETSITEYTVLVTFFFM